MPDEQRRLESLRRLEILDTPADPGMEDIVDLLGRLLETPLVAIRFVDASRVWTKASRDRAAPQEAPRGGSLADLALSAPRALTEVAVEPGTPLADHPMVRREEPLRRVAAAPVASPDGQPIGVVELGWTHDTPLGERGWSTLHRAARHVGRLLELRGEASEYRRFISLSPDAVTVLDLDGRIELANQALCDLIGLDRTQGLIGRTFLELVAPDDRARVATELARVLFARRRSVSLDMALLHGDGRTVRCSVTAGHLRGSRRSLQLSIRDLDDRIRAEEERAQLSEQLAQAQRLDLAGQLASGLAHDLKNMLVVMHSNLDLATETVRAIEEGERDVRPLTEDLAQLRSAVDRAGQLTTKLMQFSRSEPGVAGDVHLGAALASVLQLLRPTIPTGVEVRVELADDLPQLAVDPVQLEQALVNVVMNSCDALPDGGTITVRAVRISREELLTGPARRAADLEEHVYLEVSDDGVGMSDETLARAFQPLFTTKGAGRGTGLGLPTVLAFAQEYGGAVDLTSRKGEGTRVTMLLPAITSGTSDEAVALERDRLVGGAKVLLVDPGELARRVITRMLEAAGYRVVAVPGGEEALEKLDEHSPDLLVAELALPGQSGLRLVEELRERLPDLPALVFTPSETAASLEGVRTLVKPFSHDRLLRTLEELRQPIG